MFGRRPRSVAAAALDAIPAVRRTRADRRGGPSIVPSIPVLQQILDEYGLVNSVDEDGDLGVRWERCSVYFFFYGERREVLQARLYLNHRYDVELRNVLMTMLDDWNRTKLYPKAYTVLPDDGMVGVCAECVFDFDTGMTRDQLKYTVGTWIQTLLRFADWIDEQIQPAH